MSIVIIEDSRTQRLKLQRELEAAGHEVLAASDGAEGLQVLRARPQLPKAVITDILMPQMDGYEVCRQIRADPRLSSLPILVLTELTRPADVLRAVEAGADNYCSKPYTTSALLDRLQRAMHADRAPPLVEVSGESFQIQASPHRIIDILVSSLTDATERFQQLAESRAQLLQAHDQRQEVMRTVVHELRSPLQAMLTAAAMAPKHQQVHADLPELVQRQGKRIQRILGDLSDLTSVQLGRLHVDRSVQDLGDLVRAVASRLDPTFPDHHIHLQVPSEPLRAAIDAHRIEQVLSNLLTNAAKYAPNEPRIELVVCRRGDRIRVEVRDRGIGVAPEDQEQIFERYFRAKPAAGQAAGLGLGLFLSHHLVRAHGGAIGVESQPGLGSTFWFELPAEP